jgi:hypothetical protein
MRRVGPEEKAVVTAKVSKSAGFESPVNSLEANDQLLDKRSPQRLRSFENALKRIQYIWQGAWRAREELVAT